MGWSGRRSTSFVDIIEDVSAQDVIEQFKSLPPQERAQVVKFIIETDESWIPDDFKQGMEDIATGRVVDLDTAFQAAVAA